MINWNSASSYKDLIKKSQEINKPILLDLYSQECKGCVNLDENIYNRPEVIDLINRYTLPLRVNTDNPDKESTAIINNHIYIWSPTVQLLSSDGTRYHEWYGAPRQTRYSVGYVKTHHEIDGDLTHESFLAQLFIALGKSDLRRKSFYSASAYFEKVINEYPENQIALKEASYWLDAAKNKGEITHSLAGHPIMNNQKFSRYIESFINKTIKLSDCLLMKDWTGTPGDGDWEWYTDCLRELVLQVYQRLCDFNVDVLAEREKKGLAFSATHKILADFHLSYREFQSSLIGVKDEHLDTMLFEGQRSLRENIAHCILSEWWAHSPQIRHALELKRQGKDPAIMPAINTLETYGEPIGTFETLEELLSRYEVLHSKLLAEFSAITEEELDALSKWWEPKPVKISFRLKRLGWHLRDHRVSLENIIQEIGYKRTQVERFCQLIYMGLAKAESALIGLDNNFLENKQHDLMYFLETKTNELGLLK